MQHQESTRAVRAQRRPDLLDLAFLASTAAFFLLSLAYLRGCDRL